MPIYVPGKRSRHGRIKSSKRSAVAHLNMTAMVDMFTVLCVFLLQNYATTDQVLPMPEAVDLPQAHETKELKPSTVVVISADGIVVNSVKVAEFRTVKEQEDWVVQPLAEVLKKTVEDGERNKLTVGSQLRDAVNDAKQMPKSTETEEFRKLTIQADKNIDFLTVKKIMFTANEVGIQEINFAVVKLDKEPATPL